ncbi:Protein PTHB1 [Schistosoma japonicum]|nr:Protein PTHB1 [Schistosoma japonicum]
MSLFKIRDIWSSQLHKINVDDGFCLKLSPLHKLNKSQYFILFGTSFGTLYIFLPRAVNISANEKTNDQLWNYNDLCLEYNMEDPILSIDCGNLTTEICQYQQIVILHSRMVSVYNFTKSGDSFQAYNDTFSLESWKITLLFNLNLQKASYKLFLDKFFEQIETDIICVQTVDASLYFFNTTGELLQITLPNVIIPGPMIFLNSIHSLIIGASMKLDCFSIIPSNVKSSELIHCGQKNISLNWSIILEEPVFNLELIDSETSANKHFPLSYIIVLGRKRIFLISETGFLLSSRRIDIPSKQLCVYGYSEVNINSLERLPFGNMQRQVSWEPRYLVTTEKNQLLVFKGTQLLWSALLSFGTIHISMPMFTMGFDNQNKTPPVIGLNFSSGLIVVLNRNGRITLSYLGTDPSDLVVPNIMKSGQNDYNNDIDSNAIDYNLLQLNNNNFDEEMHQLNEHINQLLQIRSPSLPSSNNNSSLHEINFEKSTIPKLKTTIRLNSNPLNASVTELCFIDVDIEFPKIYSREQFHSVYLLVHSCPPIVIRPNYVEIHSNEFNNHDFVLFTHNKSHSYSCTLTCHSMNDLTDEDSETSSLLDDQPPLDMVVTLMLHYTFTPPNNVNISNNEMINCSINNTHSVSSNSITKCITHCIKLPLVLFTSSTYVNRDQCIGKYSLNFQLITKFYDDFQSIQLSDLFPNLMPKNYATEFNNSSVINNQQHNSAMCVSFCRSEQTNSSNHQQCIYISMNYNKKCQLKLKSNYPETFWPILQEFLYYNNLIRKCQMHNTTNYLYIILSKKNTKTYRNDHSVPATSPSSLLSSSVNATLQIEVFLSSLYKSLDNYVNKRLELSNQIEKLTVQARHYRCVQREVLDRIKSTQPNCLNGFNELLEKDLINLTNICDLIDSLTKEYFRSGYSVISLIILLSFICLFCIQPSSSSSSTLPLALFNFFKFQPKFILFKPAELLSMLHSTLLLDNVHITSLSTSPLTTESYEENFHVSFEQYLQAEINYLLKILQSNHINSSDEQQNSLNPYQKSLDQLSVVKCINERFFQLCQQLMSCENEEIDRLMNILN